MQSLEKCLHQNKLVTFLLQMLKLNRNKKMHKPKSSITKRDQLLTKK
jgi:hypothetical protein